MRWGLLINEEDGGELVGVLRAALQDQVEQFHDTVLVIVTHPFSAGNRYSCLWEDVCGNGVHTSVDLWSTEEGREEKNHSAEIAS